MSLRKDRLHLTGITNIDFRSKKDLTSINFFQPWKTSNNFGTMGNSNFTRSYSAQKRIHTATSKISTQRTIATDTPDPRYYTSSQFYTSHKISPLKRNIFTSDRIAQLDEAFKGKDRFTGDSMMIAALTKQRRRLKKLKFAHEDHESKQKQLRGQIIKDKGNKNKEAMQETQLVKVEVKNTLEGVVDVKKIKEIRLALRRRYANRSNFRKIFKEWDITSRGEISIYDAHLMINKLSIPINYNETRVLIASSNDRGSESLNMEEFMHLIFNDNNALNVDLSKMEYKEEDLYNEKEQEGLKMTMINNIREMSKTQDINQFKEFIRARLPKFVKYVNELGGNEGVCDYDTFMNVLNKFQLVANLRKEPLLRAFYDLYKNENGLLDWKRVSDSILQHTHKTYFSETKDAVLALAKDDIKCKEEQLNEMVTHNARGVEHNKRKTKELTLQLEEMKQRRTKREEEEKMRLNEINSTVPSTQFINKVYSNRHTWFTQLNDVEKAFDSARMITMNQRKTRFGANPQYRDTGVTMIYGDKFNKNYNVSETERFAYKKDGGDIVMKEKMEKTRRKEGVVERKRKVIENVMNNYYWRDYFIEEKERYTQLQKGKLKYNYEDKFRIKNQIVE